MTECRERRNIKYNSLYVLLLETTVVVTVFSQIVPIDFITRPAMYVLWGATIVLGCIRHKWKIHLKPFTRKFFLSYILFFLFCAFLGLYDEQHLSANYIRVLIVPLLVTIAGDLYSKEDRELFNRMAKLYLASAVVFAIWVQVTYIPSYSVWIGTKVYLFIRKNSAGQIWISAIILNIFFIEYKDRIQKILCYAACLYLLIISGLCQCRTPLLGICVAFAAYAVYRSKHKIRWMISLCAVAIMLYLIPFTRQFIEQAMFLTKYAGADLNTFSSGRLSTYEEALEVFRSSPIFGVGEYYVDNSYILILAESGLIGFFLIEWIWVKKIVICCGKAKHFSEKDRTLFLLMTVFYIIESMLEGYPPFGPGVSSFMFWFFSSAFYEYEQPGIS